VNQPPNPRSRPSKRTRLWQVVPRHQAIGSWSIFAFCPEIQNQTMTKLAAFLCGLAATAAMVHGLVLPIIGNACTVVAAAALAAGRRRRPGQRLMAARECPEIPLRPRQNSNEIAIVALG
jgi:hypothetical protein